ncbi:histidine phosphatase family protein [Roseomonas marmotae]|uniref:Histidine phosphatase family protein n=1 Tax=Roseomonas marmotae TaxID=2768161 RepID=A0ABS3KFK8_9PROT|nr:histidine phosphatase family protein [Roseomonas marmotae]MBO1075126.1 histidine phosphatase family protein [Roseomonas marmotae]QTI79760.1 histidine phosphatase family protein [Roseomonas marmotae]
MILLRHGQSEFNLHFTATRRDPGIKDPRLTELGHQQAEHAAEALLEETGGGIRRIIASPYTRAMQTAAPLARRLGLPVIIQPLVRERYAFACDIGSPRTTLALEWPELDLSHIDEVWWPAIEEPADQVEGRARLFRQEMAALPDWNQTVVVSHWGFILSMTGQSVTNGQWLRCDPTAPGPEAVNWKHS